MTRTIKSSVTCFLLLLVSAPSPARTWSGDSIDGERVTATFSQLMHGQVPKKGVGKITYLSRELAKYYTMNRLTQEDKIRYVALLAANTACGEQHKVTALDAEARSHLYISASAGPLAKKVKLLAFPTLTSKTELAEGIEFLRANRVETTDLEALKILLHDGKISFSQHLENLLSFAENRQQDYIAGIYAAFYASQLAAFAKDGKAEFDLSIIERAKRLESKATKNLSAVINEDMGRLKVFEILNRAT